MTESVGLRAENLTAVLRRTKQTLCVPAAEYVPAMGDAMLLLDRAIQLSYQTDPQWVPGSGRRPTPSPEAVEAARRIVKRDEIGIEPGHMKDGRIVAHALLDLAGDQT